MPVLRLDGTKGLTNEASDLAARPNGIGDVNGAIIVGIGATSPGDDGGLSEHAKDEQSIFCADHSIAVDVTR
jgi:hypothetical protein